MVNSKGNAKRDHLLGTINKYKIWWLLTKLSQKKGFEKGLTLTEILREIKVKIRPRGFSKPTVISALKKLQADGRLFKFKWRYFRRDKNYHLRLYRQE